MIQPKVVNIKSCEPYDIYIGRPSKFGNIFTHLTHLGGPLIIVDSRAEAVARYKEWVLEQPELIEMIKKELRGKILGCHCEEWQDCHGKILLEIANS